MDEGDRRKVGAEFHIRIFQQMNPSTDLPEMTVITDHNEGFLDPAVLDTERPLSLVATLDGYPLCEAFFILQ